MESFNKRNGTSKSFALECNVKVVSELTIVHLIFVIDLASLVYFFNVTGTQNKLTASHSSKEDHFCATFF